MASPAIQDLGGSRWLGCFAQAPSSIEDTADWRPAGTSTQQEAASLTTKAETLPPSHKSPPPLLSPQEELLQQINSRWWGWNGRARGLSAAATQVSFAETRSGILLEWIWGRGSPLGYLRPNKTQIQLITSTGLK